MPRTETVKLTNMCMVYDGDKVLIQNKVDDESWNGITFPRGHVEKGEPFTDAVIREVFEETGLTISSPQLCGIKDWIQDDGSRYMVLLYKTNKFTGKLKSSEEGEVYWVDLNELSQMKLDNDMNDLVKVFLDDNLSEFRYYKENDEWKHVLK